MSEQPQSIDGTNFELCEFEDQCESCLHYGPIYFGHKNPEDGREGHYHCEECVRGMVADPEMFAYDDDDELEE